MQRYWKMLSMMLFALMTTWVGANEKILVLGDSNTARGAYIRFAQEALNAKEGEDAPSLIKAGVSGETISGLSEKDHPGPRGYVLNRLDKELAKHQPDWVVACYGINCGIYHPYSKERFEAYQNGVKTLIEKVHASGAKLILLTPPPYAVVGPGLTGDEEKDNVLIAKANKEANAKADADPMMINYKRPFEYYDVVMEKYSKWIMEQVDPENNIWTVDIRTPLLAEVDKSYGKDRIHYNKHGHQIIADTFVEAWEKINK